MSINSIGKFKSAFVMLVLLFFMWGFITSLNDILIPHLKAVFSLSYTEAMLIQFCFFGSYFLMSLPAGWLIEKWGYARGIVVGLTTMGIGCLLFYPASTLINYPVFLFALFVLASGVTTLQVAANPYVAAVGPKKTASSRLNLSQGFNSLAHTIAPIFGTYLILADDAAAEVSSASAVQLPYFILAFVLFILALLFSRVSLPKIHYENEDSTSEASIWNERYLLLGGIGIFLYVGIEVSIGGFIVNFITEPGISDLSIKEAGNYVSYYWGAAMVGRFTGSAILQKVRANLALSVACIGALVLVATGVTASGSLAMWAVLGIGFFNSIMFSNIFTLSIEGLGTLTSRASGVLVMAIVGGAIIPLIQGALADSFGVQTSFIIGLVCYGYVLFFSLINRSRSK